MPGRSPGIWLVGMIIIMMIAIETVTAPYMRTAGIGWPAGSPVWRAMIDWRPMMRRWSDATRWTRISATNRRTAAAASAWWATTAPDWGSCHWRSGNGGPCHRWSVHRRSVYRRLYRRALRLRSLRLRPVHRWWSVGRWSGSVLAGSCLCKQRQVTYQAGQQ